MKVFVFFALILHLSGWAEHTDNFSIPQREYDSRGRLTKERFLNGKSIEISYDELNRVVEISIEEAGSVNYKYDDTKLLQVSRVSPEGQGHTFC